MAESPKTEMLDVGKLTGDTLEVTFILAVPGGSEKRYPMRAATMRVGRSDQADIAIKEPSVSSRHLEFQKDGGALFFTDAGSSNGTFLNGQRTQQAQLNDGDVLRLGNASTITVQIGNGGGGRRAPAPVNNEQAGSTMMISASDLDSMRGGPPPRGAPAPAQRRPQPQMAPAPYQPQPTGGNGKVVIIAAVVAALVVVGGGIGAILFMKSRARAQDMELLAQVQKDAAAINEQTPCTAVQDSVATLIRLEQQAGVEAPSLPAKSAMRASAEKFVDVQRDKARQYKRIISTVEQNVTTAQVTVDRIKTDLAKINDEGLKAKGAELSQLFDARMQLAQDFVGGWRKLQGETERYADLVDAVFVKGSRSQVGEFGEFRFTKQAPQVLASCKKTHAESKTSIETSLETLKQLSASR